MIHKGGTDKSDSVVLNQDRALSPPNRQFYRDGHLLVDLRDRVVMLDRQILTLTRMEYRLLALFVEHVGEVVPRRNTSNAHTNDGCAPSAGCGKNQGIRR